MWIRLSSFLRANESESIVQQVPGIVFNTFDFVGSDFRFRCFHIQRTKIVRLLLRWKRCSIPTCRWWHFRWRVNRLIWVLRWLLEIIITKSIPVVVATVLTEIRERDWSFFIHHYQHFIGVLLIIVIPVVVGMMRIGITQTRWLIIVRAIGIEASLRWW